MAIIEFPKDFRFGASTASYQIEGHLMKTVEGCRFGIHLGKLV
ncbi:family 1 glycosylhydrolase [Lederbergia ruris]